MAPVVLITREHAEPLASELRRLGAEVVHLPLWGLRATHSAPPLAGPPRQGVLVSSAAVARLASDAVAWMRGSRVVAVGEATARSLRAVGLQPDVAEGTGRSALAMVEAGACFVGARHPALEMAHAIESGRVSHWAVYERVDLRPHDRVLPQLAAVTLASPSAARAWASLGVQLDVPVAVIGPTTEEAARLAGLRVAAVAACPTMADLALAAVGFS